MKSRVSPFAGRLESDRLYLRRYRRDDAAWYCEMARRNHRHLARYESGNAAFRITDEAAAKTVLQSFEELWQRRAAYFLGAFLAESDTFVAQIHVGVSDAALPRFTLGFFADCEYEGQGYVAEAVRAVLRHLFDEQLAHKVDLWCDETNVRCWRLAERCGFRREARLREDKRNADGSISGSLCYALLREQYAEFQLRDTALSGGSWEATR